MEQWRRRHVAPAQIDRARRRRPRRHLGACAGARVRPSDILWREREKRLVIGMSRLDWEQAILGEPKPRRLTAALRFDRVLACKARNIDLAQPKAALDLVGIEFHPTEAPSGCALLIFADGGALRLDRECLECELTDLGPEDRGEGGGGEP